MSFCSQILLICECGCGERVTNLGNRFIHGHHLRGKPSPSRGKPMSEVLKQKIRENMPDNSGENNPMFGKHQSEETIQKIRENRPDNSGENHPMFGKTGEKSPTFGRKHKPEEIRKMRENHADFTGENNHMFGKTRSPETREKISKTNKHLYQNPEWVKKWAKACAVKPNKAEVLLLDLLNEILQNEYEYTGDFSRIIAGKSPDFVSSDKIIELYGDYWHRNETEEETKARVDLFAEEGYDTLIVWEHELKNPGVLVEKILEFHCD